MKTLLMPIASWCQLRDQGDITEITARFHVPLKLQTIVIKVHARLINSACVPGGPLSDYKRAPATQNAYRTNFQIFGKNFSFVCDIAICYLLFRLQDFQCLF